MSGVDAAHLVVAVALTYLLGFERDLRGAAAGDRTFALIGAGAGVIGIIAAHGAQRAGRRGHRDRVHRRWAGAP